MSSYTSSVSSIKASSRSRFLASQSTRFLCSFALHGLYVEPCVSPLELFASRLLASFTFTVLLLYNNNGASDLSNFNRHFVYSADAPVKNGRQVVVWTAAQGGKKFGDSLHLTMKHHGDKGFELASATPSGGTGVPLCSELE